MYTFQFEQVFEQEMMNYDIQKQTLDEVMAQVRESMSVYNTVFNITSIDSMLQFINNEGYKRLVVLTW